MRQLMFSGKGTNLKTGKEIEFHVPETMFRKGLEALIRNVRISEVRSMGCTLAEPGRIRSFLDSALLRAGKNDNVMEMYCGMLSRRLGEVLLRNGFPSDAASLEFRTFVAHGKIIVAPKLCVNREIVKTPEQIALFMVMVREDIAVEFQDFAHPSEFEGGASA